MMCSLAKLYSELQWILNWNPWTWWRGTTMDNSWLQYLVLWSMFPCSQNGRQPRIQGQLQVYALSQIQHRWPTSLQRFHVRRLSLETRVSWTHSWVHYLWCILSRRKLLTITLTLTTGGILSPNYSQKQQDNSFCHYWPVYIPIGNICNNVWCAHHNSIMFLAFLAIPKSEYSLSLYHSYLNIICRWQHLPMMSLLLWLYRLLFSHF